MLNLRIDRVGYKVKPTGQEIGKISNRLSDANAEGIPFEEFCNLVGEHGHAFCVSDFYGKRRKENFKSQQVFALDFDITKKNISTNVNAFMKATALQIGDKYINCFVPPEFPKVKYTILSATASEDVYKLFFKDRIINCMECREVKYKGKLIQDCSRSFSRRDIDGDEELLDKILKENPNAKHIITFMKYKEQANGCMIHYGNTEGCDYMKGEDIVVIGTPHYNEMVYKLFAAHLNIDVDVKMKFLEIEEECYKYWLHTYEEPSLRKIQLWLLKSELIQAVGRARLLRYPCTVKLYASIPLQQAEIVE